MYIHIAELNASRTEDCCMKATGAGVPCPEGYNISCGLMPPEYLLHQFTYDRVDWFIWKAKNL